MKKIKLSILIIFFATIGQAGTLDSLKADIKKNAIEVKGLSIQAQTPISKVIALLGKPSRVLLVAKKERIFIYDSIGLTFETGKDAAQKVERIVVSFNPKGNNRIAQASYKGVVMLGGLRIVPTTTSAQIAQKTPIKEFNCFSNICSSVLSKSMLNLIMNFTDDGQKKMMDIVFIIKH